MGWRFFDRNPDGSIEQFSFDPSTGRCAIRLVSDVEPLRKLNASQRQDGDGYNKDRSMQHVARVNAQVIAYWAEHHGVRFFDPNHTAAVLRLLDSNEYRDLRTGGGTLSRAPRRVR